MELKVTANLSNEKMLILQYYGDKRPHRLDAQFFLAKTAYKKIGSKKFVNVIRKFCHDGILACYGSDYNKIGFIKREHKLTSKGDSLLREATIYRGGELRYYKYFKRLEDR